MSTVVSRTCTELSDAAAGAGDVVRLDGVPDLSVSPDGTINFGGRGDVATLLGGGRPLSDFRLTPAYVLLGNPGAGKTTEFKRETGERGDAALMISARDFITLDLDSHPEWRDRVLFIDGLDEVRAGREDSRVPLDEIRNRLDRLRPPGFRISCREADWLGHTDRHSLGAVSPDSKITVLRLDPLSEEAACQLLESRHSVQDGGAFMAEARRLDLEAMLKNPLTLGLLADAVEEGGNWPETRLEAFEMACHKMAVEYNREHLTGSGARPLARVVDAAGYLCALHLLSGTGGFTLPSSVPVRSLAALAELREPPGEVSRDDLEHALGTKLFTAPGEGAFVPVHRQIAEFLAGRYLAKLIGRGPSARRVVGLMRSPSDRRVVTSLRGLSAWLAVHSPEARPLLIDADPEGVGLYGDIEGFTPDDRNRLLESLATLLAEASMLDYRHGYDRARAFRSLATADMVPALGDLLHRRIESTADEEFVAFILEVLSNAEDRNSVADLGPVVETILTGDARSPLIRTRALDAYLHIVTPSEDRTRVLRVLLDDIQEGSVPDVDDRVRGGLLAVLYPEVVTPSDVWRYVLPRSRHYRVGRFRKFWSDTLLDKSSNMHIEELLDSLRENASTLVPVLGQSDFRALPAELLARCLEAVGDEQEPACLYGWLATVGGNRARYLLRKKEPVRRIRAWLEARPEIQKEIVLAWLRRRGPDDRARAARYWLCHALHESRPPADFGLWCLDQAVQIGDGEPEVSAGLMSLAYESLRNPLASGGLTLGDMQERTRGHPTLAQQLDALCEPPSTQSSLIEDDDRREIDEERQQEEEQRQQREEWAENLREEEAELRENRFGPPNLHTLALAYHGLVDTPDRHESPEERIGDLIGGDPTLVDAVMAALRGAVSRDDVPEVDDTISLSLESKHPWLAFPVLASLDLLDREDPTGLDDLPGAQKRKALAVYYCVLHKNETPPWHNRWLHQDPEMVLDVLYHCAVAAVRKGKEPLLAMNALDAVEGHEDQVHEVRLMLLEALPTRSTTNQLSVLDHLLTEALDYPDKTALLALAEQKQASTSMPIAQRIRWWATDALIVQGTRLPQLKPDLVASEVRVRHLAEFLKSVWDRFGRRRSILADIQDPSTLGAMIEILGRWCAAPRHASGTYTLEMEISDLISSLIGQLSSQSGDEAKQALADLVEDRALEGWHWHLTLARQEQSVIHRDASYRIPSIKQVQDVLDDGPPADAADLRALLEDRLSDISDDLRGGSSDPWRQFWNEEQHSLIGAKPEDSCRDALLDKLRPLLPDGVYAAREGSYAADTRADISVRYCNFNVPIEIKKDAHRDLWKAMRDQLMAQYTTDPDTDGHGIYLVLWFADSDKPVTRHPDGTCPTTPEELRQRLEQQLTAEEARKISVIVLDVTKPGNRAAA